MSTSPNDRWSRPPADPVDEGFRVPLAPVDPRAGRRWRIVGLAGVAAVGLAIALAQGMPATGPDRPPVADHPVPSGSRPSVAPQAERPIATPLPVQEWFTGPEAPMDSVLLDGETVRWLHIASARATEPVEGVPGRDLLLRSAVDGTLCLCIRPADPGVKDAGTIEAIRVDVDLNELSRSVLRALPVDGSVHPATRTLVAIEPARDGTTALLAWLIPSRPAWTIGLDAIDLAAGVVADSVDLSIRPPRASYFLAAVPAPTLQIAPDGRHAIVTVGARSGPEYGFFAGRGWIVGLDGTRIEGTTAMDLGVDLRLDGCAWTDFVSAEVVAAMCDDGSTDGTGVVVHRWGMDGRILPGGPLHASRVDPRGPLLDQTDGLGYLWDPVDHRLVALDLVRGGERSITVADRDVPPGVVSLRARGPASSRPDATIHWSDGGPGVAHPTKRLLVASPDGRWLYAAGRTAAGGSTGVWLFDARTLELVERWPALASYDALALAEDGRWLMAIGRPGVTAAGDPAAWGVSLTVHDARSGRPIRRIDDVADGGPVAFHRDGPRAVEPSH